MDLWTEKYRPKTLDEYVWTNPAQRVTVESWIASGSLPHLLLSGVQGSGKTSLAKLMLRELKVVPGDVLEINASRERDPNVVATKILTFCTTWGMGNMKYVLLDEADSMTPLAQRILRGEMENYAEHVRFIMTCNYPNKIIPALHSRCQGFHFEALDEQEFMVRIASILNEEGVAIESEEDISILQQYISVSHPDLRKCINLLQQNVQDGKLSAPERKNASGGEWITEALELFKAGSYLEARKLIVSKAQPEDYQEVYRFMYQNLYLWGADQDSQDMALMCINKGLCNHGLTGDVEINLAATLAQLYQIARNAQ